VAAGSRIARPRPAGDPAFAAEQRIDDDGPVHPDHDRARLVGALIEAALIPYAGAVSSRRRPAALSRRMPEPSRTTRRFERELADVARSTAMRVMIDREPGSGRLFAARRIHQLRTPGTALAIHLAGLAQLRVPRRGWPSSSGCWATRT
jgi:hypothetical protein